MARETIETRAAIYFGMERHPRRSIKLARNEVLTVGRFGIARYQETNGNVAIASFIPLTKHRARDLIDALSAVISNG